VPGFADTLMLSGVAPFAGVAESQPPPLFVEQLVVYLIAAPVLPVATN
jgi:hypothetical protein